MTLITSNHNTPSHTNTGIRIIVDHVWRINKGPQGNIRESEEEYIIRGHDICYHIIQELRTLSGWAPAQFKDYIKKPKGNGYQSLHQYIRNVAVNEYVEIQVRTRAMHIQAELGESAHWYYKDQIYRQEISETKIYRSAWRSPTQLLAKSAIELLTLARQQLLASRVYVFLDDCSTVLNLPKGATALDAAFALHSDVGLTLANVRVGKYSSPPHLTSSQITPPSDNNKPSQHILLICHDNR